MKHFCVLFLLICVQTFAQIRTQPAGKPERDPFFRKPGEAAAQAEKIQLLHSDTFGVEKDKNDGNPSFRGNVRFYHKGSTLTADEVILYADDNFVKAFGNVRLENADGSVITSEEMEYDGNTERGIASKNVVLKDPKQTIKTDKLYYDRKTNLAYFNTGGTITNDQNVMYTKSATYNVATKIIDFTGDVRIDNPEYTVEGANIKQNQLTNTAEFFGPTTITSKKNRDNVLYTDNGSYHMNTKEVYLKSKNSRIFYNGKFLSGDDMYFNQITGFGKAKGDVTLKDPKEKRYIKGGYGEIFEKQDSAVITDKPYAVKILTKDSIYFAAEKFITYQKPDSADPKRKLSFMRAFHQARLFKTNAQARADSLSFNETDGIMHLNGKPILWSGEKQVTGDTIRAFFDTKNENIDSLQVVGHAFAISKADSLNMKDEFNQVKGRLMTVYYNSKNEIKLANVTGNAQAITYADNMNQKTGVNDRIGITLSTCGAIEALFEERKVQIIACITGANMDTYPMSKIDREKRFFQDFNWNTKDRPKKWQDIFVDSPENPEVKYESDDSLYDKAQEAIQKEKEKQEAKKPKRERK